MKRNFWLIIISLVIILAGCSQNDQHQSDKGSKINLIQVKRRITALFH